MQNILNWIKKFISSNKIIITILIITILIFIKTCSINYSRDFYKMNKKYDSTLIILNSMNEKYTEIVLNLNNIKNINYDIIQFMLYKDNLKSKQNVINNLKRRLIQLEKEKKQLEVENK